VVLRGSGRLRLLVEVRFLHQGVCVEVEPWMLEPLGSHSAAALP
jgi:hypothetical protein